MTKPPVAVETTPASADPTPPGPRGQWRELVAAVLARSGRPSEDPEQALTRVTLDGIAVRPLYTAADARDLIGVLGLAGQPPFIRGSAAGAPSSSA